MKNTHGVKTSQRKIIWAKNEIGSQVKFIENIPLLTFGREYVCIFSENNSETMWIPAREESTGLLQP